MSISINSKPAFNYSKALKTPAFSGKNAVVKAVKNEVLKKKAKPKRFIQKFLIFLRHIGLNPNLKDEIATLNYVRGGYAITNKPTWHPEYYRGIQQGYN